MRLASGTAGPTQSVGDDPVLAQWVEAVKARLEAGEPVDLDDYRRQDPARAERLRRLLPTIGMMADLGRSPDPEPSRSLGPGSAPILGRRHAGRLPHRPGDRPRRHGRRLRGRADLAPPPRRPQGLAVRLGARPQAAPAVQERIAGRGPPAPPQHRAGARGRLRAGRALLRHAVHRRASRCPRSSRSCGGSRAGPARARRGQTERPSRWPAG